MPPIYLDYNASTPIYGDRTPGWDRIGLIT